MKADLHVHSVHSTGDGKQTVAEILNECRLKNIGAVALTDHNEIGAWADAEDVTDIIIVRGIEITTAEGHILAYGVDRKIPRNLPIKETTDLIHAAGGIAVAAHPYRWWSGIGGKNVKDMGFDAVEIINGRSSLSSNTRAHWLAKKLDLPMTGGSDAHTSPSVGRTYTIIPDSCQNEKDIINAILNRQTEPGGEHRSPRATLKYVGLNILRWMRRGFKKM